MLLMQSNVSSVTVNSVKGQSLSLYENWRGLVLNEKLVHKIGIIKLWVAEGAGDREKEKDDIAFWFA